MITITKQRHRIVSPFPWKCLVCKAEGTAEESDLKYYDSFSGIGMQFMPSHLPDCIQCPECMAVTKIEPYPPFIKEAGLMGDDEVDALAGEYEARMHREMSDI